MDLFNGTPNAITAAFDGISYIFPSLEVLPVTDECGKHILQTHKQWGIVAVRFGDDPQRSKLRSLNARLETMRSYVEYADEINRKQVEEKRPVLRKDAMMVICEREIPVLEEAISSLEFRVDDAEDKQPAQMVPDPVLGPGEAYIEAPTKEINLEEAQIGTLRSVAKGLGLKAQNTWTRGKFIEEISAASNRNMREAGVTR